MLDTYKAASAEFLKSLTFIPNGVIAVLVLAAAVVVALIVRRVADKLLRRVLSVRYPFLYSLLLRMEGPLRLALVLFALNLAVVIAPLDPGIGDLLGHLLRVAFIAMVGWMVIGSFNIAADIYLRRYDIAAADNLLARKHVTQARILASAVRTLVVVITVAAALMTIPAVRQFGISLFASAGIAGVVVGLAARPMLSNLIAGIQLAVTQPIRLDDAVIIENEWGWIEEIGSTYVVVRLWDWRRMIVPLTYFIEKPFQNWTRESASLIGTVLLRLEFTAPIDRIRA
ncbi:MAG TPA: mechanosensitive ion channel domain-containing protein, partial [Dongiaceae bacterium]